MSGEPRCPTHKRMAQSYWRRDRATCALHPCPSCTARKASMLACPFVPSGYISHFVSAQAKRRRQLRLHSTQVRKFDAFFLLVLSTVSMLSRPNQMTRAHTYCTARKSNSLIRPHSCRHSVSIPTQIIMAKNAFSLPTL